MLSFYINVSETISPEFKIKKKNEKRQKKTKKKTVYRYAEQPRFEKKSLALIGLMVSDKTSFTVERKDEQRAPSHNISSATTVSRAKDLCCHVLIKYMIPILT